MALPPQQPPSDTPVSLSTTRITTPLLTKETAQRCLVEEHELHAAYGVPTRLTCWSWLRQPDRAQLYRGSLGNMGYGATLTSSATTPRRIHLAEPHHSVQPPGPRARPNPGPSGKPP